MDKKYLSFDFSENNNLQFDYSIDLALTDAEKELLDVESNLKETIDSINDLTPNCDKLDYALAASSGVLCGLADIFLVAKPGESPLGVITDKWFDEKIKIFAKLMGWDAKKDASVSAAMAFLENKYKVPYDLSVCNFTKTTSDVTHITPKNHRFKSLAHNPSLLGWFYSVLDQFTNEVHFVSGGEIFTTDAKVNVELTGETFVRKLFNATKNWLGHMISDVSGSSKSKGRGQGIPTPLWTWINDIIVIKKKLHIKTTELDKDINDLASELFEKGFDFRFQTAQTIPVVFNELLVRFLYSFRRLFQYYTRTEIEMRSWREVWNYCEPFNNVTVKRMLLVAHGTFCVLDVGEAVGRGFATGGGYFNVTEFFLRLNIPGLGRFGISVFGEVKREIKITHREDDKWYLEARKSIIDEYIKRLKELYELYDDKNMISYADVFENMKSIEESFSKSVLLAEKRGAPTGKILRSKEDIDAYFRKENN